MQRGWIYEPVTSSYEALLFYNAIKKHSDSFYYKPVAVAKREQIGIKYRFFCIAAPKVTPYHPSHYAEIEIYKPDMGMPYATSLHKIAFHQIFTQRIPC